MVLLSAVVELLAAAIEHSQKRKRAQVAVSG